MTDVLDSRRKALTDRWIVRILIIGAVSFPLACGEPSGPEYARLTITSTWLKNGVLQVPYSATLVATGGDSVYSWSVMAGSLPTGLSLSASTGLVWGTPSVLGSNTFTVQAASGDGQTDAQELTIDVATTPVLKPSELCRDYPDSAIVTFEDASLEAVIRERLSLGAEERITCALVSGPTVLVANSREIASVAGIQNLTSLLDLWLRNNSISDINALSGLTSLKQLDLQTNLISDVSALSGLTNLEQLSLHSNLIGDIDPLSGLTGLTELGLVGNQITDITALGGLTGLTDLQLSYNPIHDIDVLRGLTSLERLALQQTSVSDISALSGLTSLVHLFLDNNSLSDISALSGLTSLASLYLDNNAISDISALSGLTNLRHLNLGYNATTDIGALRGLTSLTWLNLQNNPNLTDMQALLDNTGLGGGDTVYLWSTNVRCMDVAALQAKRVTVYSDCP